MTAEEKLYRLKDLLKKAFYDEKADFWEIMLQLRKELKYWRRDEKAE